MPNPFGRLVGWMDKLTAQRMGEEAVINGVSVTAVSSLLPDLLGPVEGSVLVLMVFSADYRPTRDDKVQWRGNAYTVQKFHRRHGKWLIQLAPSVTKQRRSHGDTEGHGGVRGRLTGSK